MQTQHRILACLGAFVLVAGVAAAQYKQQSANRLDADNQFITKALEGGMAEVQKGQLAESHATDDRVKQFGKRMVDDHTKANDELKRIAEKKGVPIPTAMDAKDRAMLDRLGKLNGKTFDRTYMEDMVRDHREDIAEFKRQANGSGDPDVKAFASKTLPTLEDHLKQAEETHKALPK